MSSDYSQNTVSEAIWPWQEAASGRKQALPGLTFSVLTLLAAWTIGSILYFYNHTGIAIAAFSISTFVFIASRFFPKVYWFIESIFQKFSSLVGSVLTWIFLLPFFYICFPIGKMVHILKKKDPMHRKFDPEAASYWQSCKERDSVITSYSIHYTKLYDLLSVRCWAWLRREVNKRNINVCEYKKGTGNVW